MRGFRGKELNTCSKYIYRFPTIVEARYWDRRKHSSYALAVATMVKVITIMDDVYSELYKLKASKDMSFSELFRYMLEERGDERDNIISFAGTVSEIDIDRRAMERMRRETTRSR